MNAEWGKLQEASQYIRARYKKIPEIGIVLGSGLSGTIPDLLNETRFSWTELPHFPKPSVEGHAGEWHLGQRTSREILIQRGRAHYYEGFSMNEIVFSIRLMKLLGMRVLILTNAAGAINQNYRVGDFVLIRDHINFMAENPLRGENIDALGPRFPDLSEVYSKKLLKIAKESAVQQKIPLHQGIYVATPGPMFETPAEIRAYKMLGGDVVGMSTVPEAIAARHAGMDILAISCVTNYGAGDVRNGELRHDDVLQITRNRASDLTRLLDGILSRL
ncbi:purine-nucleoside phosphorylase [Candidatus Acetothermia bacterium]|nr:purine-nucleoside phosphorylase [Candidatus Acetothermia bacterium]MBI3642966.1 purine-nucleoside phosphorylase [Candidatus Acetothermia bacterium]